MTTVKVGQVWQDNDPRCQQREFVRRLRIIEVGPTHALCETLSGLKCRRKKPSRIRLDRFRPTSTGYKLVSEAPASPPAAGQDGKE